ncbi:MAG: hypothetical protein A2579_00560 [Lysobacterales bacterium RIFOXYD1_FULL_69_11]|nr:MAG: hypothetical protein A2579_00560 [Xanthomonadales bacterium RIFOXYD1_FULL_69_11]
MSALNLRLPPALKSEAAAYAQTLGISLNALAAVALRDYLDARQRSPEQPTAEGGGSGVAAPRPAPAAARPTSTAVRMDQKPTAPSPRATPKVGRNDPCPCGSGKKFKQCHGGAA